MRIRRLWPAIAVILLPTACSLDVPSDVGTINLYLSVDKGTLPIGESVTITVTARNVGYDPITLSGPSDCLLYIQIRNSQGLLVYTSNGNCTGATVTEELEVGKDKVKAFVWDGSSGVGARLPSGFYAIKAVAMVTGNPYFGPPLSISLE